MFEPLRQSLINVSQQQKAINMYSFRRQRVCVKSEFEKYMFCVRVHSV